MRTAKGFGLLSLVVLSLLAPSVLTGCSSQPEASKADEEAFRNPPKEIPPETQKAMQEARARSAAMAAEAQRKAQGQ